MLIVKMEGRLLILFAVCLFVGFGGSDGIYLESKYLCHLRDERYRKEILNIGTVSISF